MTPTLPLLGGDTIVVSPSQLEVIRTCPTMWRWRYLYRRVKATPNAASLAGKAFDSAINLRYQRHGGGACTPETEAEMLALVDKAYEGVDLPLDEHRTPARFKEAIQSYNQRWKQEPFEVLGVQVPFAVLLGEVDVTNRFWATYYKSCVHSWSPVDFRGANVCPTCGARRVTDDHIYWPDKSIKVVLRGILDLFVRLGSHVMIWDTKTSNNDIDGNYDNSAQLKAYCWALQELARLHPGAGLPPRVHAAAINGVIIRPDYKRSDRTPTAKDKPRLDFHRTFPSFYSAERLERWRRDTLVWVEQALGWVARDVFPQNERHCTFHMDAAFKNYGSYGQQCPYLEVCSLPEAQQEMALSTDEFMDYGEGPLGAAGTATTAPLDKL